MNVPKIGNFLVFDVYSSQNETLFGGRGQGFRYNVFLTPRYVVFDVPVFAYKQFKKSKLAKAKCIVKSQKFGFELDLIETLNPFTVPQRLFFRTTKVIGKVSDAVIAKPAKIAETIRSNGFEKRTERTETVDIFRTHASYVRCARRGGH